MTGTEMLMKLMAEWSCEGEPEEVMVVFLDHQLNADYRINCVHTRAIGLARFALLGSEEAISKASYVPRQKAKETTQ